jgi:hypothetical protein
MTKPDFEKCAQELDEMQSLPLVSVEVSMLEVFAIITIVQAAIQQIPGIADDGWAKIGIAAALQIQDKLFSQDSETYPEARKVLEFGWNPEA